MSQESFIYSFVARGTMILAEYTEFTGNFPAIATQCLQKLPSTNNKFTYNCDHHTFNFLVEDGYAYCVVAKETVGKHVSIAFLERVRADFKKRYGGGKADTAIAKSLNKEFGPAMKEHMRYIIEHADEIGKLSKVQAQVSEVKSIMIENIDKELTESRAELLTRIQGLKQDLQSWRSKLDTQVKTYRDELSDLKKSLNVEVDQLKTEFQDLRTTLQQQQDDVTASLKNLGLHEISQDTKETANSAVIEKKSDEVQPPSSEEIQPPVSE